MIIWMICWITNPWNPDPLDLDQDANRDKALQTMQEQHRRESRFTSTGSRSSSGKRHHSGSHSRDKADSKKGRQTPTEDWNSLAPVTGIHRPTLDWSQDILEPQKQMWKLAAGDATTPRQTLKSVVKPLEKPALAEPASCSKTTPWTKPALAELASCGKGRGQTITEKLQEMANAGPAAASQYTGNEESWRRKPVSKRPAFLDREEQEARKWYKAQKNQVVNHQQESISERYISLK